jgi:CRP-like cAMP-binding protein
LKLTFRNNRDLDLALLDVEDRIRRIVIAKISQETLAEMIGTTRSRVSFFMNKFRELGFIDYNGGISVHSSLLNAVLHDQPQIKI